MTKFRIEKGISRVHRVKLQASIEESVTRDLALMCEWSNNDKNYVVNQLLRFALCQDHEFQSYRSSKGDSPLADAKTQPILQKSMAAPTSKPQTRPPEPGSGV